jgi:Methyl-accepting chemotaxis protein
MNTYGEKTNLLSSLKTKIALCILLCVFAALLVNTIFLIPNFRKSQSKMTESNMLDLSNAYSLLINEAVSKSPDGKVSTEDLTKLLKNVSLDGIQSSYTYLVDANGTMLYHPTADKIGSKVENEVIKGVIKQIKSGQIPEAQVVHYTFKGVKKYASYTVLPANKWILVVSADESEIMANLNAMRNISIILSAVIVLLFAFLGYLFASQITAPIKQLTILINNTANLDFTQDNVNQKIYSRSDETGVMSRAIRTMRENMHDIINKINLASDKISENSISLNEITHSVNEHSSDNSATSEELAASMEETSATTDIINENLVSIESNTKDMKQKTMDGTTLSVEISKRADTLKTSTLDARNNTNAMYKTIRSRSSLAMEQAKAVDKIHVLTDTIMSIADQTSLLALNASIEAARAGESGKGFAVVANEISNLATQSSQTINNITTIVSEVNVAVNSMSDCLEQTLVFLDETVGKDYNHFIDISVQYDTDAHKVQDTMTNIHYAIEQLSNVTIQITEAISGINTTIGEAAAGVTDIAGRTSDIVSLTSKTYEMVQESMTYSKDLKDIVNLFKL